MTRMAIAGAMLLSLGACDGSTDSKSGTASQTLGRYVIVHSPHVQSGTILLDTATGKTWNEVKELDMVDEPLVWTPMPQLNSKTDIDAFGKIQGWKGKTSKAEAAPSDVPPPPPGPSWETPGPSWETPGATDDPPHK